MGESFLLDIARFVQAGLEAWVDVRPGSLVLVLFLGPDDFSIRVFGALSLNQIVWERRDL